MKIKAISLWQPWASLVALGAKNVETRKWSTTYRGPLAIHATKTFPDEARRLCHEEPFAGILADHYGPTFTPDDLPRGVIVAVTRLESIVPAPILKPRLSMAERAFGDYGLGRVGWMLKDIVKLDEPVPARGRPGLWGWQVPAGVAELLEGQ